MAKYPALPLFTDALIADTHHLTDAEFGAYMRMLIYSWRRPDCDLPSDRKHLARIMRRNGRHFKGIEDLISEFFDDDGTSLTQARLRKERKYVEKVSESRRVAGRKGGRPKQLKNKDPVKANGSFSESKPKAPTPTPTPIKKKKEKIDKKETPLSELSKVIPEENARHVIEHRQRLKKPLTARAAYLMAKNLAECPDPVVAADTMIERGWQSIKPEYMENGPRRNGNGSDRKKPSQAEDTRERMQNVLRGHSAFGGQVAGDSG